MRHEGKVAEDRFFSRDEEMRQAQADMDHTQFNPNLTAALYVAEVLDNPLLGDFQRHLKECSECADEVAYWERGRDAFEGIRRFIARRVKQRHFRWVMVQLVVAFIVGVAMGAIAAFFLHHQ